MKHAQIKCCIKECKKDGCYVYSIKTKAGQRIVVNYCDDHVCEGFNVKEQLLRVQTEEEIDKIKGLGRLEFCTRVSTRNANPPESKKANSDWEWVDDFGYWMAVTGEIKKIRELDDKEIEDAVIAIRRINIKRVTKKIGWLKEIEEISAPTRYEYPDEALRVEDIEEAYAKLDEFYEVLAERSLLP